tara:strand:- start:407 stop:1180 length:774 start_codon:yes stop_codon:yes gene_type:complete
MKYIEYNCKNRVGYISFLRKEKRNAINNQFINEFNQAFILAEKDNKCKIIVLQNIGNVFCSGADLKYLEDIRIKTEDENIQDSKQLQKLFDNIYNSQKITISKIKGHAIAGGCGIISCTDFNYCTPDSKFGFTEVKIGFIPAIVSLYSIEKIGFSNTKKMFLSGEIINSEKAKRLGMIDRIIEESKIDEEVNTITEEFCKTLSKTSISEIKKMLQIIQKNNLKDYKNLVVKLNAKSRKTDDFKRGVDAFLNKKSIKW